MHTPTGERRQTALSNGIMPLTEISLSRRTRRGRPLTVHFLFEMRWNVETDHLERFKMARKDWLTCMKPFFALQQGSTISSKRFLTSRQDRMTSSKAFSTGQQHRQTRSKPFSTGRQYW